MSLFFIHGGPGFNSTPEENLLKNEFKKLDPNVFFWNEPSQKRQSQFPISFNDTLTHFETFFNKNADESNILVAHSFGAFTALSLSQEILSKVSHLFLISPILDLRALDENIVAIAIDESKKLKNEEKASELTDQKEKFNDTYDLHRFNTTLNALVSVDLLSFYWFNKDLMQKYQSYFQNEYEFDIGNFQSIRMSIKKEQISKIKDINIPITIYHGQYDRISKKEDIENIVTNNLPHSQFIEILGAAHYPHIEETKTVFDLTANELKV